MNLCEYDQRLAEYIASNTNHAIDWLKKRSSQELEAMYSEIKPPYNNQKFIGMYKRQKNVQKMCKKCAKNVQKMCKKCAKKGKENDIK